MKQTMRNILRYAAVWAACMYVVLPVLVLLLMLPFGGYLATHGYTPLGMAWVVTTSIALLVWWATGIVAIVLKFTIEYLFPGLRRK